MKRTQRFREDGRGQGLVEYALLIALVVVVVVAALLLSGQSVSNLFTDVNNAFGGDVTSVAPPVTPDGTSTTAPSPTPQDTPTPEKTPTPTASDWKWKQSYDVGDLVVYRDVTYRCISPVQAKNASQTPPKNPKYWEIVVKSSAPASPF